MTTKPTHGGRRPGSGPKPKPEDRCVRKTITVPPDTHKAIKAAQKPGEGFSECVCRLALAALKSSEHEAA